MTHTFQHRFVETPILVANTTPEGKRFYTVPGGGEYSSITTMLAELPSKALEDWKKRKGPIKAAKIAKKARDRGTKLHGVIEKYLLNEEFEFVDPFQKALFQQVRSTLHNIDNIRLIEKPIYSDQLRLAGQPDCIAEYGGVLSVIDFKTSGRLKEDKWITSYYCQGGAYSVMFEERFHEKPEQIVIIVVIEDGVVPQIFTKDSHECFLMLQDYAQQLVEYRESIRGTTNE